MSNASELRALGLRLVELSHLVEGQTQTPGDGPRARWATPQEVGHLLATLVTTARLTADDASLRKAFLKVLQPFLQPPTEQEIESAWKAFTVAHQHASPKQIFKAGYAGPSS